MNRLGIKDPIAYLLVGMALWLFVLNSGVHATLAGVVIALAIPYRGPESTAMSLFIGPLASSTCPTRVCSPPIDSAFWWDRRWQAVSVS